MQWRGVLRDVARPPTATYAALASLAKTGLDTSPARSGIQCSSDSSIYKPRAA
jgi:hypothetical protein